MKKWMEKEYSQWVYYDDENGKIIGSVYKVGTTQTIWGAKINNGDVERFLGQYIDSDFAKKSVEGYWDMQSRTVLEYFGENNEE